MRGQAEIAKKNRRTPFTSTLFNNFEECYLRHSDEGKAIWPLHAPDTLSTVETALNIESKTVIFPGLARLHSRPLSLPL